MAALSQVLKVNTLYKITVTAYNPKRNKKIIGKKSIISCHSLTSVELLVITANHTPKITVVHDSHSSNFVICKKKKRVNIFQLFNGFETRCLLKNNI